MMTTLGNKKTSHLLLDYLCFEANEDKNEYSHIELEAKRFILRYRESLKGYFIEQINHPDARIEVDTIDKLHAAFILITDKNLNL